MSDHEERPLKFRVLEHPVGRRSFLGGGVAIALTALGARLEAATPLGRWQRGRLDAFGPPFLMVTLGDSIMWGQGLPEPMKFRNIASDWITGALNGRAVRQFSFAHSGAQIISDDGDSVPNLSGEIPSHHPSITRQASLAVNDVMATGAALGAVDLVLLDGGINDVSVNTVIWPGNSTGKITQLARDVCVARMATLLPLVMRLFPNAAIVVTGYFPVVSEQSNISAVTRLVSLLGGGAGLDISEFLNFGTPVSDALAVLGPVALAPLARDQIVRNSAAFKSTTDAGFAQLVSSMNQAASGPPRVAFATPTFAPENCYGTGPQSYLFGPAPQLQGAIGSGFLIDETNGAAGINEPTDPLRDVQWRRGRACNVATRSDPLCLDACIGHPNPRGAQVYADAVLEQIMVTLAPHLATRGLVENAVCATLRAQENKARNQVNSAEQTIAALNKDLQGCISGNPADGQRDPSHKPKQCGADEIAAEKKTYAPIIQQGNAALTSIAAQKRQARCWY